MPPLPRTYRQASTQKRQQEEENDSTSTLSEHDSREFNNATVAYKDPYY